MSAQFAVIADPDQIVRLFRKSSLGYSEEQLVQGLLCMPAASTVETHYQEVKWSFLKIYYGYITQDDEMIVNNVEIHLQVSLTICQLHSDSPL